MPMFMGRSHCWAALGGCESTRTPGKPLLVSLRRGENGSWRRPHQAAENDRLADHEAFGPPYAGERAELGVAALDELAEQRRIHGRGDAAGRACPPELTDVAVERASFALVVIRHVDDERRSGRLVDEVIADPVRFPRLALRFVPSEPRVEDRFGHEFARGAVIGMAIGPVRGGHDLRTLATDEGDYLLDMRRIRADAAVGYAKVLTPDRAQHLPRGLRLGQPFVGRSVAAHLAARQVAQPDLEAERRVARDGTTNPDFNVVGMWAKGENIDHFRIQISDFRFDFRFHDASIVPQSAKSI